MISHEEALDQNLVALIKEFIGFERKGTYFTFTRKGSAGCYADGEVSDCWFSIQHNQIGEFSISEEPALKIYPGVNKEDLFRILTYEIKRFKGQDEDAKKSREDMMKKTMKDLEYKEKYIK